MKEEREKKKKENFDAVADSSIIASPRRSYFTTLSFPTRGSDETLVAHATEAA